MSNSVPSQPVSWGVREILLLGMFAVWAFTVVMFTLGKTDRDPGPPPPVPMAPALVPEDCP